MEVHAVGYASRSLDEGHGILVIDRPGEDVAVGRAVRLGMLMMASLHPERHKYAATSVTDSLGRKGFLITPGPPCLCARPGRG